MPTKDTMPEIPGSSNETSRDEKTTTTPAQTEKDPKKSDETPAPSFAPRLDSTSRDIETPILSNIRKIENRDEKVGSFHREPFRSKSVSFEEDEDQYYGQFLETSARVDSPGRQDFRTMLTANANNTDSPITIKKQVEMEEDTMMRLSTTLDKEKLKNDSTYQTSNVQKQPSYAAPLTELFNMFTPSRNNVSRPLPDPEGFRTQQEFDAASLSLPELPTGNSEGYTEATANGHKIDGRGGRRKQAASAVNASRRRTSITSEITLGSEDDETIGDGTFSDGLEREESLKTLQVAGNRRVSLTVDMETGKSPGDGGFHRGQYVMRRSFSSDMMNAQSPRTRRRRAVSQNLEQMKKFLSLPPVLGVKKETEENAVDEKESKVLSDLEEGIDLSKKEVSLSGCTRQESLESTNRRRCKRYNVEQKSVQVLDDFDSETYRKDVQYHLAALKPKQLRRRKYRNSMMDSDSVSAFEQSVDGRSYRGNDQTGILRKYTRWACHFLTDLAVFTFTQGSYGISSSFVNRLLFWSFRNNFIVVFLLAACSFYVWTFVFAIFLYLVGIGNPECIHVNGVDFDETRGQFSDAFALSWTTFTTVGYGLVYPGTSATVPEGFNIAKQCTGMVIMTTMEAFIGILFSAFWGAIFFVKVTRVASFAQVTFSNAMIIKYGTGVKGVVLDGEVDEYGSSEDDDEPFLFKQSKLPCPFLEFRIVNRLWHRRGGEIIDASINIVASMDEKEALRMFDKSERMTTRLRRKKRKARRKKLMRRFVRNNDKPGDILVNGQDRANDAETVEARERAVEAALEMVQTYSRRAAMDSPQNTRMSSSFTRSGGSRRAIKDASYDTSTQSKSFPKQAFAQLAVESLEHPFFKRVWNVRHVLDESSPILKPEAKELIRLNNGHWPEELNNAAAVRASIHFDQILVSFSGTSNVDANSVYSQKVYNFDDVCVGYSFCNMLFRDKADGRVGVDFKLLNDVNEQSGGGGEPLVFKDGENKSTIFRDIFIL